MHELTPLGFQALELFFCFFLIVGNGCVFGGCAFQRGFADDFGGGQGAGLAFGGAGLR